MVNVALGIAAAAALALARVAAIKRRRDRPRGRARAVLAEPTDDTTMDAHGAVRSVQAAELTLPAAVLAELWSPMHLERLARTYWRFLSRCTLGLIRVKYDADERAVVFVTRPFVLLRFHAPEFRMDAARGVVRWRIASGVLVSRAAHGGDGYLQIEVERCAQPDPSTARVRVEVEVANFYPALASGIARWLYSATQSRIHVIVTHGFLRSLVRLDLAESVVGRYGVPDDVDAVPDPPSRSPRAPQRRRLTGGPPLPGRRGRPGCGCFRMPQSSRAGPRDRGGADYAGCVRRPVACMVSNRRGAIISAAMPTRT